MSKQQITVRIPEDLVGFADGLVVAGQAESRADVVARALENERRRLADERDAAIYAATTTDPDSLDALARWASRQPMDID